MAKDAATFCAKDVDAKADRVTATRNLVNVSVGNDWQKFAGAPLTKTVKQNALRLLTHAYTAVSRHLTTKPKTIHG